MRDLNLGMKSPWIVLGDFNNALFPNDLINRATLTNYHIRDFVSTCEDLGLIDMNSTGCRYTCSVGRASSKIDRVLINSKWLVEDWACLADFKALEIYSDHTSCIVSIGDRERGGTRKFRFFNFWTEHDDFLSTISEDWGNRVVGTAQLSLVIKLKNVKEKLNNLTKNTSRILQSEPKRRRTTWPLHKRRLLTTLTIKR